MPNSPSRIAGAILCGTALTCIAIPVAPHFVRTLSSEHRLVIETGPDVRSKRKLTAITPAELRRLVTRIRKDTVIIHFWNTWRCDGTRYLRELKGFTAQSHPRTAVVHVCTDMSGIQQQKASRMIADRLEIPGPLFGVRSTASIFDLRNEDAALHFYKSLTGKEPDTVSPSVLALNSNGLPFVIDGGAAREK
ncbi:MAG: hypothetical protein ACKOAG_13285 [Candidatus Kapaibacterium sp.]